MARDRPARLGLLLPSVILALAFPFATPVAAAERALDVDEAVQLALVQNPELRASGAELQAARAQLQGASLLVQGNPDLDLSAGSRLGDGTDSPEYEVSVAQPLEIGGRRAARIEAARAGVLAAEARLSGRRIALAAEVRQAFARALAARALRALAADSFDLARQALKAAEHRERAGDASRIEVNAARLDVGRAGREVQRAVGREQQAVGELRLLLNLEPDDRVALDGELGAAPPAAVATSELVAQALQQRPELAAARAEASAARAEERLANKLAFPSPRVGARYGVEEGAHIVQGTLGFELPLFNRNQAGRGVARARATQAQVELEALERRVTQEVELAAARRRLAAAAMEAYGGEVLRAAQENASLVNEGYRAGQLDIFQMLLVRREALEVRQGNIEALEELQLADAALARALGRLP